MKPNKRRYYYGKRSVPRTGLIGLWLAKKGMVDSVGLSASEIYQLVDPALQSIISADGGVSRRSDADIVARIAASPLLNFGTLIGTANGYALFNYFTTPDAILAKAYRFFRVSRKTAQLSDLTTCQSFGDSITNPGVGASVPANKYISLLDGYLQNIAITNKGVSGHQGTDQAHIVVNTPKTTTVSRALYTVMVGINDEDLWGESAPLRLAYIEAVRSMLIWLATLPLDRVDYLSSSVSYNGAWSDAAAGKTTSVNGDYLEFSIFGDVLYVSSVKADFSGVVTIAVDGVVLYTFNGVRDIATQGGLTYSAAAIRISGLSNAAHTVRITKVSGEQIYFRYAVGRRTKYPDRCMKVLVSKIIDNTWSSTSVKLDYNNDLSKMVNELISDGLPIKLVSVENYFDVAMTIDGGHPNDTGHAAIAQAFYESI